ncbi:MAG: hypothetical protein Udaeo_03890 [Candidatus Udaeobacter sp.]|nr:MAG: hypothetical protein Udaeo_03890 [Candidatus Udaeobacter sp.]
MRYRKRLGSARLQRAGRRILRRRTSGAAHFIVRCPDPRIIFILFSDARIPRISQDIVELFGQVAIRPNVAVECFFLPHRSDFLLGAIDVARGKRFQGTHQLSQGPEFRFIARSFVLWPGLKQGMHMIRHDADGEEFIPRIVKMTPCVQHNGSSLRIKGTPMHGSYCHGVDRPRFFEMREPTTRVMSARC